VREEGRPERREVGAVGGVIGRGVVGAVLAAAWAVALGTLPGEASAQDPPVLTLQEAVERAARHNPAYRRTTNDLRRNALDHREAWLSILPTTQVSLLRTGLNWSRSTVTEDFFGNPIEDPISGTRRTSDSQQGAGLFLQLDPARFLDLRQQADQAQIRELLVETGYLLLRGDVLRAFLDAQEEQVAVELEEELLAAARVNLETTRRLYTLAQRDRTDVLSAELDVAEKEAELEARRARQSTAHLRLRNLIGDPDLDDFRLDPAPVGIFDPDLLDEESLVAEALTSSPRILQAEGELQMQERNVTRNRAFWLPTVSLNASTTRRRFIQGGDAFLDPLPDADLGWNVGLTLSLPDLGQYFQRGVTQERARVDVRNQEETLRERRGEVEEEVRSSLVELRSAHRSMALQDRRADLAQENRALTLEAYRLGRRTFLELQTATEQAAQARRSALQSRFDFERARVNLERALGIPLDGFLPTGA
jgi:outer membrane protein TolC